MDTVTTLATTSYHRKSHLKSLAEGLEHTETRDLTEDWQYFRTLITIQILTEDNPNLDNKIQILHTTEYLFSFTKLKFKFTHLQICRIYRILIWIKWHSGRKGCSRLSIMYTDMAWG